MTVEVLRLGHRPIRDKRITTHIGLVARAFGADKMLLPERDENIEKSVCSLVENWGGDFSIDIVGDWKSYIRGFKGTVVHLTMYGMPVDEAIGDVTGDVLVVVGSEKVPRFVFDNADYNISIGNQPHSEVSALAIFLDRFFDGAGLKRDFGGKLKIEPSTSSKIVKSE
ncbi:tRNA (cytidine(56)-2'-O)-methyltransferase [archaeon]|nr:tRNA (cytidine(56)-2'-O)-methyltransferase [archaeon]